ncbi:MAG: GNAT family N-acetyltransferase [Gammaproteobacteria bacterium]|nr:MAG: GNAT family N-acetyltransferase [Gammaproteobacteria bacterium]
MDAIALRQAIETDAAALGSLHVASWLETYNGIMPSEILADQSVEARTEMWCKVLHDPESFNCLSVYVAEYRDHLAGFGSCGRQRDDALADAGFSSEINAIYILRAHQNQGVGRRLMDAMSQSLSASGHASVSLWVLRENAAARKFYESLGGVVVGEKTDDRQGAPLIEVAYGWQDLRRLLR